MKRQRGMTITSLLVAMAVGLILVAAMLSAFTLSVRSGTDVRRAARLNQDLRVVMERMVSDIRRAGYWGEATSFEWGVTENPFTAATTDIAIDELTGEDADSCIVFSYDFDQDGVVDYDGEGFGFRLNAGEVDVRSSTTGAGAMGCTGGSWEPLPGLPMPQYLYRSRLGVPVQRHRLVQRIQLRYRGGGRLYGAGQRQSPGGNPPGGNYPVGSAGGRYRGAQATA